MIKFNILTIFPNIFDSYFNESIIRRAKEKKKIKIDIINIRDFTKDKHKSVDDRPYGGGPGMVLKIEPIFEALKKTVGRKKMFERFNLYNPRCLTSGVVTPKDKTTRIILTDPDGKLWSEKEAMRLAKYKNIVIICGHYEGVDARVEKLIDEKISIGNYILTGGELAAMVITDSVSRLAPGVLGNPESLTDGTNSKMTEVSSPSTMNQSKKNCFDYPHYTRPEIFNPDKKIKWRVPKILLSGNAGKIKSWRQKFLEK